MPYTAEHKTRTRERIVGAARLLFNQRGFLDVSIDEIMAEAGLTRGGFYNHFRNKEDLLLAAIESFEQCNPADVRDEAGPAHDNPGKAAAKTFIDAYLCERHLDDVAGHCPLVALPADVARAGTDVKTVYQRLLDRMTGIFGKIDELDADTALALTAMCVGAMLIGRTTSDRETARRFLRGARKTGAGLVDGSFVPQGSTIGRKRREPDPRRGNGPDSPETSVDLNYASAAQS